MCVHTCVCVPVFFFFFFVKNKQINSKIMSQMRGEERVHTI